VEHEIPPSLERGDRIAIVAPGNGPSKNDDGFGEVYRKGVQRLEDAFDLEAVEMSLTEKSMDYRTSHPEERAEELMEAFRRDDLKGALAVTGGSGEQVRILKHLDGEVLRENATRFYGLSDNTSVLNFLWQEGVAGFYGPNLLNNLGDSPLSSYTEKYCRRALFEESVGQVRPSEKFTDETLDWKDSENLEKMGEMEENPGYEFWNGDGTIEGITWGGCLEVLSINLQAQRFMPSAKQLEGKVLMLETSEEIPEIHWIDWFMNGLGERGILDKLSALIIGRPKTRHHRDPGREEREQYRAEQKQSIKKAVKRYSPGTPVVFDLDFGHTQPLSPLPVGGTVNIDFEREQINF
jgi:muramoyltetrapeptide carboxypeptidase LdcA involved in peptidoglycan recycling